MDVIIVEYSSDMRRWAQRLGGSLSMDGHKVIYKQVDGISVLRFRVNGNVYDWEDFHHMVSHALHQGSGRRGEAARR